VKHLLWLQNNIILRHFTPYTSSFNPINGALARRIALMPMSKKSKPGQPGTKRLFTQCGERLVCLRYRYDAEQHKRFKTIELIVEESLWQPLAKAIPDEEIV
jgi:hypothetical protein